MKVFKTLKRLVPSLLLLSCGPDQPLNIAAFTSTNAQFERYRYFFERYSETGDTSYIPINYGDVPNDSVAVCRYLEDFSGRAYNRRILVTRAFNKYPKNYRYLFIAHELVHCHLGAEHEDAVPGKVILMSSEVDTTYPLTLKNLVEILREQVKGVYK